MRQLSFFAKPVLFFGGEILASGRKGARPLDRKRPLHCVLKAGNRVLYANRDVIYREIQRKCRRFGIKAYSSAVNFDHLHMILKIPSREAYTAFVRTLTAALARRFGRGLWKQLPFTRVMSWGRDFRQGLAYLQKNREEAAGAREYEPRKDWYSKWKSSA